MAREKYIEEGWYNASIPRSWIPIIKEVCIKTRCASISEYIRIAIRNQLREDQGMKKK